MVFEKELEGDQHCARRFVSDTEAFRPAPGIRVVIRIPWNEPALSPLRLQRGRPGIWAL
jgi:hypothetical protein